MKYYFDFDNTLVRTHHLRSYMGNPQGRDFLTKNCGSVETALVNPKLVDLVKCLGSNAAIITNSPRDYAAAFLVKHGFPEMEILGSADKPCSGSCLEIPAVYIGDEPLDVLFAHERRIPSIAYTEGAFFPISDIKKAQPTATAKNVEELEKILSQNLKYESRQIGNLVLMDTISMEDFPIHGVQEYYSPKNTNFKSSGSHLILAYKRTKNYSDTEIDQCQGDSFFYNGSIIPGTSFSRVINGFYNKLQQKIQTLDLKGTVRMIAIPNSLPEFAYLSDPNYRLAFNINQRSGDRNLYRVKPVKEAHSTGFRNLRKHIGTLGVTPNIDKNVDNIILFDDITTSGSQFTAVASLLRKAGYQNNIIGLALGKTIVE